MASSDNQKSKSDNSLRLRCVNRCCENGENLLEAYGFVCSYYQVKYKPNKEVILIYITYLCLYYIPTGLHIRVVTYYTV